jgi:hypothetical protein
MHSQNEAQEEIKSKINDTHAAFYSTHSRNVMFKNSQKMEIQKYHFYLINYIYNLYSLEEFI